MIMVSILIKYVDIIIYVYMSKMIPYNSVPSYYMMDDFIFVHLIAALCTKDSTSLLHYDYILSSITF